MFMINVLNFNMKRLFLVVAITLSVLTIRASVFDSENKFSKMENKQMSKNEQVERKSVNEKTSSRAKTMSRKNKSNADSNSKKQAIKIRKKAKNVRKQAR